MVVEQIEAVINELKELKGQSPDEETIQKRIEKLQSDLKMAKDVEAESEGNAGVRVPKPISSLMGTMAERDWSVYVDTAHQRVRFARKYCGEDPVNVYVTYRNDCKIFSISKYVGKYQVFEIAGGNCDHRVMCKLVIDIAQAEYRR